MLHQQLIMIIIITLIIQLPVISFICNNRCPWLGGVRMHMNLSNASTPRLNIISSGDLEPSLENITMCWYERPAPQRH